MATEQQTTNRLQGYPPSADPDQVVYADQSRRLIDRKLDESGVTQLGHSLPRILVAYSQAKQPVVRVLADARHSPRQNIEGIRRQPAHLPQRVSFEPWPVVHLAGRNCRIASSSSIPPPVPASARSRAS